MLLRWIAYARSPLNLGELAEVTIVDTTVKGAVDTGNRGGMTDVLQILAGLVIIDDENRSLEEATSSTTIENARTGPWTKEVSNTMKARLAHFSMN